MSDRETFPSIPQAALLLLAGFMLQYVIGAGLYDVRRTLDLSTNQMNALVTLLANGILLAFVVHIRGTTYGDLIHPSRSSHWGTLVLVVPPVLLLVPAILLLDTALISFLESLFPLSLWEEQAFANMVSGNLAAVISTCVLAPLLEEMLFRGVLLRGFLAQHTRWAAISFSALFFGVAHFNIYQFALAFLLGLLLGWLFERTRSLIPCIALHAAVNTWIVASATHEETSAQSLTLTSTIATWSVATTMAIAGLLILRRLFRSRATGGTTNAA